MRKEQYYLAAAALALLAAAAMVYTPGLRGPFVFDDLTNILQVPGIRITDLGLESLLQAWDARDYDDLIGRPLAMLTFGLNYYFTQFDVFYFKITNLVIHLVTGVAMYVLTLALLRRHHLIAANSPYHAHQLPWLALGVAGIWLLHPLNLTSVLYVVQRMNSLSALFTVLGLIGYCRGREQIIEGRKAGFLTIAASLSLFGLLGVLCKENAVLLLPLAVVVEMAFYRFATHANLAKLFRRLWYAFLLLPLIAAAGLILFQHERWFGEYAYRFRDFTLEERLFTEARAIWFYLRLILLPDIGKMGLYHDDFPMSEGLTAPFTTLLSVVGLIGLAVLGFIARTRSPVLFFAIAWFFVGHSMESTILPLELIHEHRNYLPQYGILFGFVYFLGTPYTRISRTLPWRLGFLAFYAVLLGLGTFSRSLQWQDENSLYAREVINHPTSARAHTMRGAWLHWHGSNEDALRHLTIAASIARNDADHLVRLVQHVYVMNRRLPEPLFEELRHRLLYGRISAVTLWVYEPLLLVARGEPVWHDRFIDLYAMMVGRSDLEFNSKRYAASYRILAENHAYQGRADVALQYYDRARAILPDPIFDIATAKLYLEGSCIAEAEEVISRLRDRIPKLDQVYENRLREVETAVSVNSDAVSRCRL